MKLTRNIFWVAACLIGLCAPAFADEGGAGPTPREGFQWAPLASLAIQDRGRMKPLETFAVESVQFVTGRRSWKGISPTEVIFSWLIAFDKEWDKEPFIKIGYEPLKKKLGLEVSRQYFSPAELQDNKALVDVMRDAVQKEQRREKLDDLEKKAVELQNQRGLVQAVVTGQALTILPHPQGMDQPWPSLGALAGNDALAMYSPQQIQKVSDSLHRMLEAFNSRNAAD